MDATSPLSALSFDRRTALHTLTGASVLAGAATLLGTTPAWAADALPSGATLGGNQKITSPNGAYRLVMQTNGDLVLYKGTAALWWTGTIKNGMKATMQTDGNLVVRRSDNTVSWSSRTHGFNRALLKVKNDGNLVMYQNGLPTWSRHHGGIVFHQMRGGWTMRTNQFRLSQDRRFKLVMQADGNLVLYRVGAGAMWASGTRGTNHRAAMQTDGNFVIYNASNKAVWSTRTAGRRGAALILQNDGNLVLKAGTAAVWSTRTGVGTREIRAHAWARSMIGANGYYLLCERFVENAYGTSGRFGTALLGYQWQRANGRIRPERTAPLGALHYFSNPALDYGYGHVAISNGMGGMITSPLNTAERVHQRGLMSGYLGWAYAPANWGSR